MMAHILCDGHSNENTEADRLNRLKMSKRKLIFNAFCVPVSVGGDTICLLVGANANKLSSVKRNIQKHNSI